jgi:acetyltransferase-like isoleucine patch superfamily enzyme
VDAARAYTRLRRVEHRIRGVLLSAVIRAAGGKVGHTLTVERGATFRQWPHRGVRIGDDVHLARGVVIDVPRGARLELGDGSKIMHYTVIAAAEHIRIGAMTQVAECCSVRDADHGVALDEPMFHQLTSSPTIIGDDVWIARGCAVLKGTTIGDGAVLGANSVLKGVLPPRSIAVGAPARVVRERQFAHRPEAEDGARS